MEGNVLYFISKLALISASATRKYIMQRLELTKEVVRSKGLFRGVRESGKTATPIGFEKTAATYSAKVDPELQKRLDRHEMPCFAANRRN